MILTTILTVILFIVIILIVLIFLAFMFVALMEAIKEVRMKDPQFKRRYQKWEKEMKKQEKL